MLNSQFLSKEEWLELQREFKSRFTVLEGQKEALIEKIKSNLDSGYGAFDGTKNIGLIEQKSNSSSVIEALKENGKLSEATFSSERILNNSSIIEALKDNDKLLNVDFSNKKDSIGEFNSITGSDSDNLGQSKSTDKKDSALPLLSLLGTITNKRSKTINIKNKRTFTTKSIIEKQPFYFNSRYSPCFANNRAECLKESNSFYSNTDSSLYDLNKNTFVKEFYAKMSPFLKDIMNILQNKTITNIEKQE
jgi:hypothetical protein